MHTFLTIFLVVVFVIMPGCGKDNGIYGDNGSVIDDTCRDGDERCDGTQPQSCVDGKWSNTLPDCISYGSDYYCTTATQAGKRVARCVDGEGETIDPDDPQDDSDNGIFPDDESNDGDPVDVPDTDPVCGNGIVEGDEVCDGNHKKCSDVDEVFTSGLAECKEDCSGWDTAICTVGGESLYGFVQTQHINFSYIRGRNTPESNEKGVIHVHAFIGNYGSRYLAMDTGLTTVVADKSSITGEEVVSIRDITRVGTSIMDPLVVLDIKMPIHSGNMFVGLGDDDDAVFFIADLSGSNIRCIHAIGIGSLIVDAGKGIESVSPEGQEHTLKIQGNFDLYHPTDVPAYGGDITDMIGFNACLKQ